MELGKKVGKNIQYFKEAQDISDEVMAKALDISKDKYQAMEKGEIDITLNQLEIIAKVLSCSLFDLISIDEPSGPIRNYFFNRDGNNGININVQGINQEEIRKAYKELYKEELNRIPKLEHLLKENNIDFDF